MTGAADEPVPDSVYYELFKITESLCVRSFNDLQAPMTIFDVLKQDTDDVIMLINYYIERGAKTETTNQSKGAKHEERIRVTEQTATNGWW